MAGRSSWIRWGTSRPPENMRGEPEITRARAPSPGADSTAWRRAEIRSGESALAGGRSSRSSRMGPWSRVWIMGASSAEDRTTGIPAPRAPPLQPRVHRLALQGQHPERALVHPAQRLPPHEALQPLDPQREFPQGQRALARDAALAETLQVLRQGVFRTVDDPQVLPPPALERRLDEPPPSLRQEIQGLDHHPLAAAAGEVLPPGRGRLLARGSGQVHHAAGGGGEQVRIGLAEGGEGLQVPEVVLVHVDRPFARQEEEGGEAEVRNGGDRPAVAAVGVGEAARQLEALAVAGEQAGDVEL